MKKRLCVSLILAVLLFMHLLTGCTKCVNTETSTVKVRVVDKYHRPMYMQPVRCGKVTSIITHPAVYRIRVTYKGVKYSLSGSDVYNKYFDKVGEYVKGTLVSKYYDDGSIKCAVVSLE